MSFGLLATRLVRVWGQVISATGTPHWGGEVMLTGAGGVAADAGPGSSRRRRRPHRRRRQLLDRQRRPGPLPIQARAGDRQNGEFARMDLTVGVEDVGG